MPKGLNTLKLPGNGAPLLLLHGWGQSLQHLKPLAALLASHAECHLVDLPGFGESPHPGSAWSAYDYADRLVAYLDENKLERVTVAGHSFGGKVSLCLSAHYPERISRLILMAPSGIPANKNIRDRSRMKAVRLLGKGVKMYDKLFKRDCFSSYFIPRFGSSDYKNAGAMRPILVRSVNEDVSHDLSKIRAPTLILWGGKDRETPPEMGKRMQAMIGGSKLLLLPYHDHYLFQDVGSHLVASHIAKFLKGEMQ